MDSIGKTLAALVFTLIAAAGMLMTACGGLFTIILLPDSFGAGQGASYSKGGLAWAVPSLVGGIFLVWISFRMLSSVLGEEGPAPPTSAAPANATPNDGAQEEDRGGGAT